MGLQCGDGSSPRRARARCATSTVIAGSPSPATVAPLRAPRGRGAWLVPWLAPLLGLVLLGAGTPAGLGPRTAADVHPAAAVPRLAAGDRRLLLVMIDGLPVGAFERALAEGALPRLSALLAARPTLRTTAVATFPSATAPSVPELLSGRYCAPDNPEPDAVHAFDRERRRVVRYVTQPDTWQWPAPNLFDALDAAGLRAVTVFEGRWQGPRAILTRAANFRDAALEVAGITKYDGDRGPVEKLLRELRGPQPPAVALLVFNAVDLAGHFHGPDSAEVREALSRTDALLGEVLTALAGRLDACGCPLLDETTLVLFGDHGMVASGSRIDLQPLFRARGLSSFDASSVSQVVFRERLGTVWTKWPDVVLVSGGSNITGVYLRSEDGGWSPAQPASRRERARASRRPDPAALAKGIVKLPGVAQVLRVAGPSELSVEAAAGRALVLASEDGSRFAYVIPRDAVDDPFGYLADPAVASMVCREGAVGAGCFLSREEWIRATLDARYPGAVALAGKAFDPPRFAGDLVVTALPGYSFLRGQKGDHGNFEREAMLTPLVLNGPGVVPAEGPARPGEPRRLVRLLDIYPTAAVLLGASPADPALATLDGRSLVAPDFDLAGRLARARACGGVSPWMPEEGRVKSRRREQVEQ